MNRHISHVTHVLITIDTEFRLGGSLQTPGMLPIPPERIIYCRFQNREYGIDWIMDTLERFGLRGVFFVETESRYAFGEDVLVRILDGIRNRGHEIQLHCHPAYRSFRRGQRHSDDMRSYSLEQQTDIIGQALAFLARNGLANILAFRSGGFFSSHDTIRAAQANGLRYLSNYNLAVPNCDYISEHPDRNDIFPVDRGYEIPVTCFREIAIRKEWNPLQTCAASGTEFIRTLRHAHAQSINVVTILTHSFEFVRPHDSRYENATPLLYVMHRFETLCKFVAEHHDNFEVVGFRRLDELIRTGAIAVGDGGTGRFFKSPFHTTFRRYLENVFLPLLGR